MYLKIREQLSSTHGCSGSLGTQSGYGLHSDREHLGFKGKESFLVQGTAT